MMWKVGPKFKGVQFVPPGPHFLYWSTVDTVGEPGVRIGLFLYLSPGEVLVRRWDEEKEVFDAVGVEEANRYALGSINGDFVTNLGSYPHKYVAKWTELTSHITHKSLKRLEPMSKTFASVSKEYDESGSIGALKAPPRLQNDDTSARRVKHHRRPEESYPVPSVENGPSQSMLAPCEKSGETDSGSSDDISNHKGQPTMESFNEKTCGEGNVFYFLTVPPQRVPPGSSAAQITELSMDSTPTLRHLIDKGLDGEEFEMIGEMQFSFIVFLLGHNYEGFEQWRSLVWSLEDEPPISVLLGQVIV
eukprot:GHVN01030782.1.p1 GENE.GHVN01030782.1~~GHVN01030782.1.p1  ORF type:complete len:304 (-),score=35.19 GHVN01030782.1:1264-2175(-)